MKLQGHILASPLLLTLYPVSNATDVAIAIIASWAIDLDHLQLIIERQAFSFSKLVKLSNEIYATYRKNPKSAYKNILYPFHTVEVNIILLIVGVLWWHPLIFIVAGFAYHIVCDTIHHLHNGMPIFRWLFLVDYLYINSH